MITMKVLKLKFHDVSIFLYLPDKYKLMPSVDQEGSNFGYSTAIKDDIIAVGAPGYDLDNNVSSSVYLFNKNKNDGTQLLIKKLHSHHHHDNKEEEKATNNDYFGFTLAMDEKIVIGSKNNKNKSLEVYDSKTFEYERTISCPACDFFGEDICTYGNKIASFGYNASKSGTFLYSTDTGELLTVLESYGAVAMSKDVIVTSFHKGSIGGYKTFVYGYGEEEEDDEFLFRLLSKIPYGGQSVDTFHDRIIIGYQSWSNSRGVAYLYSTNGEFIRRLEGPSEFSNFGISVALSKKNDDNSNSDKSKRINNRVFIGARNDIQDDGTPSGSVYVYHTLDGKYNTKIIAHDYKRYDWYGFSVAVSDSYMIVGSPGSDVHGHWSGSAYVYNLDSEYEEEASTSGRNTHQVHLFFPGFIASLLTSLSTFILW